MSVTLLDYQVLALIAGIFILTVYGYSVGLKEGKRIDYHRGRSVSWSTNKEIKK